MLTEQTMEYDLIFKVISSCKKGEIKNNQTTWKILQSLDNWGFNTDKQRHSVLSPDFAKCLTLIL